MLRSGYFEDGQSNLPSLRQLQKQSKSLNKVKGVSEHVACCAAQAIAGAQRVVQDKKLAFRLWIVDTCQNLSPAILRPYKAKTRFLLPFAACGLSVAGVAMPIAASAQMSVLGVVKSEDNTAQWSGITRRLSVTGVPYCVVDLQQVKDAADIGGTRVLFLPNVESFTATQVKALQEWMSKGGQVIVTGPTGTLSQPTVRSSLRSLLGAYWGFAVTTPATVQPLGTRKVSGSPTAKENWSAKSGLSGSIRGGVIIPASITSQTAATWKSIDVNNLPAVVATNQSVFLGWRWGIDTVSSVELDSAWLLAALNHYGVGAIAGKKASGDEQPCPSSPLMAHQSASSLSPAPKPAQNSAVLPLQGWSEVPTPIPSEISHTATPLVPRADLQPAPVSEAIDRARAQPAQIPPPESRKPQLSLLAVPSSRILNSQEVPVAPALLEVQPGSQPIAPKQVSAMREELENLIGRFESALLASNAALPISLPDSNTSPSKGGRQESGGTEQPTGKEISDEQSRLSPSMRIATEARNGLQKFVQLIAQQNYADARQQWLQSRRILWDNYPTERRIAQPETRAVWLDRSTIVSAHSAQDLAKIFDSLAAAGINTVFFETVNAGYPIYPSRIAPAQNPLTRGWDPLEAAVKLAHERGIELHAWVWIFAGGNSHHNPLIKMPADFPGPLVAVHPNWANYDNRGHLFDPRSGKVFLDPANLEVRHYLWDLLDEIVTRYQVDGIQLDYIRYPFQDPSANQTYGYGIAGREAFKQITGVDPLSIAPGHSDLWQQWTDFRIRQIDSFVATASQRLHAKRPDLILSAAVFPFPREERLQKLQQNWEDWARRGDVDLIVPMTYALETNQLQQLAQTLLSSAAFSSTLVLPGIRLWSLPEAVAVDQIQLLRDLPISGYSLFAFENINDHLYKIFGRTQGALMQTSPAPVPYRQPFKAAAARYAALQGEWNFLLVKKQIWMREPANLEWSKQAKELAKLLNQLAAEPSTKNLLLAQTSLSSFRSQFGQWMQMQALKQPYQVQAWENQLVSLERLLGYGERMVLNRKVKKLVEIPTNH